MALLRLGWISAECDDALVNPRGSAASPPYNIVEHGDGSYEVSVNVAGFQRDELEISTDGEVLHISANAEEKPAADAKKEGNAPRYLHRGLVRRSFELRFSLTAHTEVTGAELTNGILHVSLKSQVPEQPQKRVVTIKSETG